MKKYLIFGVFLLLIGSVSASYIYGNIYIENDGRTMFVINSDIEISLKSIQ